MLYPQGHETFYATYHCHTELCSHIPIKTWGHPILAKAICTPAGFLLTGLFHNNIITYKFVLPGNKVIVKLFKRMSKEKNWYLLEGENCGQGWDLLKVLTYNT